MDQNLYTTLIYKSLKGDITPEEQRQLDDFSQQSLDNQEYRAEIELTWQLTNGQSIGDIDVEADLKALKGRMDIDTEKKPEAVTKVIPLWRRYGSIAAALGLLIFAAYFAFQSGEQSTMKMAESGNAMKHLTLQDGTQVWLNANSTLSFPEKFANNLRKIKLDGEAYFEVVRNEQAPFVIEIDDSRVQVLGTSFSIKENKKEQQLIVSVQSGKVSLANNQDSIVLIKNEQGIHNLTDRSIDKKRINTQNEITWKTGRFVFRDESFEQVVNKIAAVFKVDIQIEKEAMKACKISAIVNSVDLETVLNKMAASNKMTLKKVNTNSYILANGECQ